MLKRSFQKQGEGKGEKEGQEALPVRIRDRAHGIIDIIICVYLVMMIAVMPFYFEEGYVHIATDKAFFCRRVNFAAFLMLLPAFAVYFCASLAAFLQEGKGRLTGAAWLGQLRKIWGKCTLTDKFMGLYGVSLAVSYLCSDYKETALWGTGNGWYMGLWPQLFLVGAYFFTAKLWRPRKGFLYLLLSASAAVFLLGFLNRFGIYPIVMKTRSPDYFISTIGHINWYCGYAVTVLFAGVALVWQGHAGGLQCAKGMQRVKGSQCAKGIQCAGGLQCAGPLRRILLCAYVLLGFATLVTQGSASGIVALGVMLLILFVMSAGSVGKMCGFFTVAALLSSSCLLTELLRAVLPGRLNRDDRLIDLLTTGSLPVMAAAVSFLFLGLFCAINRRGTYPQRLMAFLGRGVAVLTAAALVGYVSMLIMNTVRPGSLGALSGNPAFTFSDAWGSGRGGTWRAGVMCFSEQDFLHKLTGVGPDAMAAYLYRDAGEGLRQLLDTAFEGLTLTNAHNEWLTVLANTGILGLFGFGGTVVTAIAAFMKKGAAPGKAGADAGGNGDIFLACGLSLLAYTLNNIFSFQQTVSLTTMMLILGMGMAFLRASAPGEGN